jgi:hypothetical protein
MNKSIAKTIHANWRISAKLLGVLSVAVASMLWRQSAQAAVTLNDGGVTKLELAARDTSVSFENTIRDLFPTVLPFNSSADAIVGASKSHAEFHLGQDGFGIITSGSRPGYLDSYANIQPVIFFSVSVDTPYSISGTLSVNDPGSSGKFASLTTTLTDVGTSGVLFNSDQESFGVVDQSFVLGGKAGNIANTLSGSPTGLLLAGHQYSLFYGTSIYAANSGDSASFTGGFEMKLGAVPEARGFASVSVLLMLLLSVRLFRRSPKASQL